METTVERLEGGQVALEVEVEPERVAEAYRTVLGELAETVRIPGFRPGKAPEVIIKARVGMDSVKQLVSENLVPKAYEEAMKQNDLAPLGRASVDILHIEDSGPLKFKVTVLVKPEVQLGEYKEVEVEEPEFPVTEEMVAKEIEDLRGRVADFQEVTDGAVQEGDYVQLRYRARVEGKEEANSETRPLYIEVGAKCYTPAIDKDLVGMRAGEKKAIPVVYPEDYPREQFRDKRGTFEVEIERVQRRVLDESDDAFVAKSGFSSFDELRDSVRARLTQWTEKLARDALKSRVLEKVVETSSVEAPGDLVKSGVERRWHELEERLAADGRTVDDFLAREGKTREDVETQWGEAVTRSLKTAFVMDAIAQRENLRPTDEQVAQEVWEIAQYHGISFKEAAQRLSKSDEIDDIVNRLRNDLVLDFLADQARLVEVGASAQAPEAAEKAEEATSQEAAGELPMAVAAPSEAEPSQGEESPEES